MCVFSKPVDSVKNTKILVAKLGGANLGKQFTVYQNQVKLGATPSAMILPLPNRGGVADQIEMVDMSGYKQIFEDLNDLFPKLEAQSSNSKGMRGISYSEPKLEIKTCGDYEYSVANTLADLDRLDWEHYEADESVRALLVKHYSVDFGFLVCKCTKDGQYSPVGVLHPALDKHVYVPTMHEHGIGGNAHSDWSHQIFALDVAAPKNTHLLSSLDQAVRCEYKSAAVTVFDLKTSLLPVGFLSNKTIDGRGRYVSRISQFSVDGFQGNGDLYLASHVIPYDAVPDCCTFDVSNETYVHQKNFKCTTCAPDRNLGLVLCAFCAPLHEAAGHVLSEAAFSTCFCDRVGNKLL